MVDLRQSSAYAEFLKTIGWKIERIGNVNIFIKPLWIFGAVAKMQRVLKIPPFEEIKPILKKHRVWMFLIDNLATKTSRVDLDNIKPKKDCRYVLRKLQESKHIISRNEFESFYKIWQKSAKRKNLWIPNQKDYFSLIHCFDKNCFCITVDNKAGALILTHDKIAYYYYAGATKEGVKENLPYLVVWECMQEAKKRGCRIWDFEGIYDPKNPNKEWLGFSHFKKSFGGYEVDFPKPITKWLF